MEKWNNGIMESKTTQAQGFAIISIISFFHYSIIPLFHYSISPLFHYFHYSIILCIFAESGIREIMET